MTINDIRASQAGDREAFGRLVARYHPLAIGYASAWLGRQDLAEDAAQDAFIDAYLHLGDLREPAAFAGWLRRIVHKHCDRQTRKKRRDAPEVSAVEVAPEPTDGGWLLDRLETLPDSERIVVALHYLGDEPQRDVAEFLGLPLTTVKKRLHTARARLKKGWSTMERNVEKPTTHEDRILLFLAIREGDVTAAGAILDRHPELLDAEERWTVDEAIAGGFTIPHRLTPLLLAAGRGDLSTVEMLLDRGADPNRTCGCDAGETPIYAAALTGRTAVVKRLLEAHADTTRKSRAGFAPVDVARIRNHDAIVELLSGTSKSSAPRPTTEWAAAFGASQIVTGIKGVDFLAPLERNTIVRVHGPAETGLTVLLAELARNIGLLGGTSVWTSGSSGRWQGGELEYMAAELGVSNCVTIAASGAVEEVTALSASHDIVALFVFLGDAPRAEVESALVRMKSAATITFVIDPWADVTAQKIPVPELAAPFDALLVTDVELANAGVYPALDPIRTRSTTPVSEAHARLREELDARGLAVLLNQPFAVYEHMTGLAGEHFAMAETLEVARSATRATQ